VRQTAWQASQPLVARREIRARPRANGRLFHDDHTPKMTVPFASAAALILQEDHATVDFTSHWIGYAAIVVFVLGYLLVVLEEKLHLRKSIPVIIAAGLIWALIGIGYITEGDPSVAADSSATALANSPSCSCSSSRR
jgi:hypothetical protein